MLLHHSLTGPKGLRRQYCPPLDEPLFISITNDHDLTDINQQRACLELLDALKDSAHSEQFDDVFDPSGTGAQSHDAARATSADSQSAPEESAKSQGETSITTGLSETRRNASTDGGDDFDRLPNQMKHVRLQEMFPFVTRAEVENTINSCHADFEECIDQLLNLAFLQHFSQDHEQINAPVPRSVDGFAAKGYAESRRKGRKGRKAKTSDFPRTRSPASFQAPGVQNPTNAWNSTQDSLDFLSLKTNLPNETIRRAYQEHARNLSATVKALALQMTDEWNRMDDMNTSAQVQIIDLKHAFAQIPERELYGYLMIARTPQAAYDLATATFDSHDEETSGKRIDLVQYAPIRLADDTSDVQFTSASPGSSGNGTRIYTNATTHSQAAGDAFSQANAAYRRAKSDRLMAGAASYYATEGRHHAQAAKELRAAMADAHVSAKATQDSIDLHGTSVRDAVRIAKASTQAWWEGLGDAKFASGGGGPARSGFHIVTGVGRHSKDGAPKIGPAVGRALIKEGWKVAINQGEIGIYGKVRH